MESDGDEVEVEEPEEDFEQATPRPPDAAKLAHGQRFISTIEQTGETSVQLRPSIARSGTMATVRIQRRARLAEKLKEVFDLDGIQEVLAGKRSIICDP